MLAVPASLAFAEPGTLENLLNYYKNRMVDIQFTNRVVHGGTIRFVFECSSIRTPLRSLLIVLRELLGIWCGEESGTVFLLLYIVIVNVPGPEIV